jgi:hypothetical protein
MMMVVARMSQVLTESRTGKSPRMKHQHRVGYSESENAPTKISQRKCDQLSGRTRKKNHLKKNLAPYPGMLRMA